MRIDSNVLCCFIGFLVDPSECTGNGRARCDFEREEILAKLGRTNRSRPFAWGQSDRFAPALARYVHICIDKPRSSTD